MADKYLAWDGTNKRWTEVEATVTSAGAADAGEIVALDGAGKLDVSLLPAGVGPAVFVLEASEALSAGDFVNVFDDSGTMKVRLADASNDRPANGYVLSNVSSAANATVYYGDINSQVSGLTGGETYFLSNSTPGGIEDDVSGYTAGDLIQSLGTAISTTELAVDMQEVPLVLA